jgi:hypothetical protein
MFGRFKKAQRPGHDLGFVAPAALTITLTSLSHSFTHSHEIWSHAPPELRLDLDSGRPAHDTSVGSRHIDQP